MFTIPNQSSIPKAYTQFSDAGEVDDDRLIPSDNRDRLVDCMEEFVKYTIVMRPQFQLFGDRYSERKERRRKEENAAKKEKESQLVNSGIKAEDKVGGVNLGSI